jgi:hypothetical protein
MSDSKKGGFLGRLKVKSPSAGGEKHGYTSYVNVSISPEDVFDSVIYFSQKQNELASNEVMLKSKTEAGYEPQGVENIFADNMALNKLSNLDPLLKTSVILAAKRDFVGAVVDRLRDDKFDAGLSYEEFVKNVCEKAVRLYNDYNDKFDDKMSNARSEVGALNQGLETDLEKLKKSLEEGKKKGNIDYIFKNKFLDNEQINKGLRDFAGIIESDNNVVRSRLAKVSESQRQGAEVVFVPKQPRSVSGASDRELSYRNSSYNVLKDMHSSVGAGKNTAFSEWSKMLEMQNSNDLPSMQAIAEPEGVSTFLEDIHTKTEFSAEEKMTNEKPVLPSKPVRPDLLLNKPALLPKPGKSLAGSDMVRPLLGMVGEGADRVELRHKQDKVTKRQGRLIELSSEQMIGNSQSNKQQNSSVGLGM